MPAPPGPYRLAVRAGEALVVSGQLGRRDGVPADGFEAQVRQALQNPDDGTTWPAVNGPCKESFGAGVVELDAIARLG